MSDIDDAKYFKGIGETLGIENDFVPAPEPEPKLPETIDEDSTALVESLDNEAERLKEEERKFEADFEASRDILHDLTVKSKDIIEQYAKVAQMSESPTAYDALTKMMTMSAGFAKDLMSIHKARADIKNSNVRNLIGKNKDEEHSVSDTSMNIENANIVVATTADVLKQLNKKDEK